MKRGKRKRPSKRGASRGGDSVESSSSHGAPAGGSGDDDDDEEDEDITGPQTRGQPTPDSAFPLEFADASDSIAGATHCREDPLAENLRCPRCDTLLEPDNIKDHGVVANAASCPTCRGFFITLEQLTEVELEQRQRLFEFRRLLPEDEQWKPLACPKCKKTMDKMQSQRDAHVTLDVCRACDRVWLDHDELNAIRTESLASAVSQLFGFLRAKR